MTREHSCSTCGGSGTWAVHVYASPDSWFRTIRCLRCNGTGEEPRKPERFEQAALPFDPTDDRRVP